VSVELGGPTSAAGRLARLKTRRLGLDRPAVAAKVGRQILARRAVSEAWELRAAGKPSTQRMLGAMLATDAAETAASLAAATDLGNWLARALMAMGHPVECEIQGSVPADTHIRHYSDVDLLVLSRLATTSDPFSLRNLLGWIGIPPSAERSLQVLRRLRRALEAILRANHPAAIDTSGSKAVRLAADAQGRPTDVVASHWHDTADYDRSGLRADRAVVIFDRQAQATIEGQPFRHLDLLAARDGLSEGGLKRAIRLCKHLKAEAAEEGIEIGLSSFQITGVMYGLEPDALRVGAEPELASLAGAQAWLAHLVESPATARALTAPGTGRPLLPKTHDLAALEIISRRLTELCEGVVEELDPDGTPPTATRLRRARL
jgi:hypothetical protein